MGKEENYKYLVALYTYHFYFFHSYSATSCEQDNVEVEEKSAMCHASLAGKDVGVFLFYFFAFKSFSGSRFNFRYVAKLFYLKIGKSSNSAELVA